MIHTEMRRDGEDFAFPVAINMRARISKRSI